MARIFQASAGAALLLLSVPAFSQTAPDLGSTSSFAIVSETYSNTTAGTAIDGDVCFTTGPAVDPTVNGTVQTPCPAQTGTDQNAARSDLDSQSCTSIGAAVALDEVSIDGGPPGEFPPGCYSSTGAMSITTGTTVTLSGDGVYIFRPDGALDAAADSSVVTADGACTDNVFWTPTGGTTIGANSAFVGTVFRGTADGLSITLGDSASLEGRALAFGSTVTTANNAIAVPSACDQQQTGTGTIIVEKQTNPQGSTQGFSFTGDALGVIADGEQIVVDNLAAGNYSATEAVPEDWELTDIVCNDTDSSGDLGTATADFVLDAGETVTCAFVNTELTATDGTITILKQADPSDTGESFDFSGDLGSFSLMHGEFIVETRPPGTYAVSETVPADWQLDSATCDNGSSPDAIALEAGESVTCTFSNSRGPLSIPIFSQGGIALIVLMMLMIAVFSMRHIDLNRR
ncbi:MULTISPECIES: ice-binding family protein [unclassified Wenzhouxiangella]|uniref:ice-binding family protein n=1 Tax=unclassified Wenzhouxiangella TaxID=2613841 RepID=UPI0015F28F23|nr:MULTISPECIES: ice-binding family protein [unclassified Wenzhouxiangella]